MCVTMFAMVRMCGTNDLSRSSRGYAIVRKDGNNARPIHVLVFLIDNNPMSNYYQRVYQCFDASFSYVVQELIMCYVIFISVTELLLEYNRKK